MGLAGRFFAVVGNAVYSSCCRSFASTLKSSSVVVSPGIVAAEVAVWHVAPVLLLEPLRIAPDAPQHARPGLGDHQPAAAACLHRATVLAYDLRENAGQRQRATAGLGRCRAGEG